MRKLLGMVCLHAKPIERTQYILQVRSPQNTSWRRRGRIKYVSSISHTGVCFFQFEANWFPMPE